MGTLGILLGDLRRLWEDLVRSGETLGSGETIDRPVESLEDIGDSGRSYVDLRQLCGDLGIVWGDLRKPL